MAVIVILYNILDEKNYFPRLLCVDLSQQYEPLYKDGLVNRGYYDTLNKDDIVRLQYSLLPYPPVTKGDLQDEKNHYDNNNGTGSFDTYPQMSLETLSRLLFKEKNSFG